MPHITFPVGDEELRVLRAGYGEPEAADAWERVFAFFAEHVKAPV